MDIDRSIRKELLKVAPAETLAKIVEQVFQAGSAQELLEDIQELSLSPEQISVVTNIVENQYLENSDETLPPILSSFYKTLGIDYLATYYEELINGKSNEIISKQIDAQISNNKLRRNYVYEGQTKQYEIFSFSNEIGKNMTLLKTPYGVLIFDCGAKCSSDGTDIIGESELTSFFVSAGVQIEDIIAVIISHAHLDHYGSLSSLINIGVPAARIFVSEINRNLIACVSQNMPFLNSFLPVSAFFSPGNKVQIKPFVNGHILGSEGFVISFDNVNVVYSGDYCLHDQKTIQGLDPMEILEMDAVRKNGIDTLITETTYGQRPSSIPYEDIVKVFDHFVGKLIENGYKIFIPSFAIGRSQEIALMLNQKYNILIDGLAIKLSKMYDQFLDLQIFNNHTRQSVEGADKSSNFSSNDIVIASSGMLTLNSTSYNYLKMLLGDDRKVAVIKTGYISSESYGNELLEEWKNQSNRFFEISLSAHADETEILTLITALNPKCITTIHGKGLAGIIGKPVEDVPEIIPQIKEVPKTNTHPVLEDEQIQKEPDESDIATMIRLCIENQFMFKKIQVVASYSKSTLVLEESAFIKDYQSLFHTMRMYPKFQVLCDAYRLTKTDEEIVTLSKAIVQAVSKNQE